MSDRVDSLKIDQARQDLNQKIKLHGEHHPVSLVAMSELSNAIKDSGDYEEALNILEKVVVEMRDILGEYDYETERIEVLLSNLYLYIGEFELARNIQEKIVNSWISKFGIDSEEARGTIENLKQSLKRLVDLESLSSLEKHIVDMCFQDFGGEDIRTLRAMLQLASTRRILNDLETAKELDVSVLERAERSGLDQEFIIGVKRNLLDDLRGLKELNEVAKLMTEIYESAQLLPEDDEFRKSLEGKDTKYGYKLLGFATRKSVKSKE